MNSTNTTGIGGQQITFNQEGFDCSDIGEYDYKFNSSDVWNYSNESITLGFNITPNDVSITSTEGSDSDVTRGVNTRFEFRIYDEDSQIYVPNLVDGIFYLTANDVKINSIVKAKITDSIDHDLIGELI